MASFLEYDPLTGVEQWVDADHCNRLQVHYRQDIAPVKDLTAIERGMSPERGVFERRADEDLTLYARIPPVVIMEMRNKWGVDIFKKDHLRRAFELINREYPHLRTTRKVHTLSKAEYG